MVARILILKLMFSVRHIKMMIMKKIHSKNNLIHCYEDVMSKEECELIYNFTLNAKKDNPSDSSDKMPWEISDTIDPIKIEDEGIKTTIIKNIIIKNIKILNDIISKEFNEQVYSYFTEIVLWRKGKKMDVHTDDGSNLTDKVKGATFTDFGNIWRIRAVAETGRSDSPDHAAAHHRSAEPGTV